MRTVRLPYLLSASCASSHDIVANWILVLPYTVIHVDVYIAGALVSRLARVTAKQEEEILSLESYFVCLLYQICPSTLLVLIKTFLRRFFALKLCDVMEDVLT